MLQRIQHYILRILSSEERVFQVEQNLKYNLQRHEDWFYKYSDGYFQESIRKDGY